MNESCGSCDEGPMHVVEQIVTWAIMAHHCLIPHMQYHTVVVYPTCSIFIAHTAFYKTAHSAHVTIYFITPHSVNRFYKVVTTLVSSSEQSYKVKHPFRYLYQSLCYLCNRRSYHNVLLCVWRTSSALNLLAIHIRYHVSGLFWGFGHVSSITTGTVSINKDFNYKPFS